MDWLKTPTITIHNKSSETISLIAFSRDYRVDLHSEFDVQERRARNIPAGKSTEVKLKDYNLGDKVLESQMYMLFRAGEFPRRVKPLTGEKLFLYTGLAEKGKWNLTLSDSPDRKNQVKDGPGYALPPASSRANAAGPQDESQLEELKKEVQELQVMVKDLEGKVAKLVKRLGKL